MSTTTNTDGAECPYCHHVHDTGLGAVHDSGGLIPTPMTCEKCERTFTVEVDRTITYYSTPMA